MMSVDIVCSSRNDECWSVVFGRLNGRVRDGGQISRIAPSRAPDATSAPNRRTALAPARCIVPIVVAQNSMDDVDKAYWAEAEERQIPIFPLVHAEISISTLPPNWKELDIIRFRGPEELGDVVDNVLAPRLDQLASSIPQTSAGPDKILHQIIFPEDVDLAALKACRRSLLELRASGLLDFDDLWLGARHEYVAHDGETAATLITNARPDVQYTMIFSFSDADSLIAYMSDVRHASIRQALYRTFSDDLRKMYDEAEIAPADLSEKIYADIERKAARFMTRHDFALISNDQLIS